jgi:hypothetical protein
MSRAILIAIFLMAFNKANGTENHFETRVAWRSTCSVDDKAKSDRSFGAAVAIALGTKLIAGAVDAAAIALKKAGEPAVVSRSSASELSSPYQIKKTSITVGEKFGCIIIAKRPPSKVPVDELALAEELLRPDSALIFEGRIERLTGEQLFRIQPVRFVAREFEGEGIFSPRKREFTIALTLSVPGADKPFASTSFTFEGVEKNENLTAGNWKLAGKTTKPLPFPPIPESANKAKAEQEQFYAPYILASDILTRLANPSAPVTPRLFSYYEDSDYLRAVDEMCIQVRTFNYSYPVQFAFNEKECAHKIKAARKAVDAALDNSQNGPAAVAWAKSVVCHTGDGLAEQVEENKENGLTKKAFKCDPPTALKAPVKDSSSFGKMLTEVTLVETRPGSKFAAFLGQALGAAKDDLTTAISTELIPAKAKAIAEAEEANERKARQGVFVADIAVTQAEQQLAEIQADVAAKQSAVTAAQAQVIKAKIAANEAYRLAGLPVPYPTLD